MLGISLEAMIFLYAFLTGMTVFFCYQGLRMFRRLFKHKNLVTGLEDLVFWMVVSGYVFRQMYGTTYGSVRWFFILGIAAGALSAVFSVHMLKNLRSGKKRNPGETKKQLEKK